MLQSHGALETIIKISSGFTHAIWQFVYILSVFLYSTLMTSQRRPKGVGD